MFWGKQILDITRDAKELAAQQNHKASRSREKGGTATWNLVSRFIWRSFHYVQLHIIYRHKRYMYLQNLLMCTTERSTQFRNFHTHKKFYKSMRTLTRYTVK